MALDGRAGFGDKRDKLVKDALKGKAYAQAFADAHFPRTAMSGTTARLDGWFKRLFDLVAAHDDRKVLPAQRLGLEGLRDGRVLAVVLRKHGHAAEDEQVGEPLEEGLAVLARARRRRRRRGGVLQPQRGGRAPLPRGEALPRDQRRRRVPLRGEPEAVPPARL